MNETNDILRLILSEIQKLNESISLIRSERSLINQSDQIRSDPPARASNNHSNVINGWMEIFMDICDQYNIDYSGIDLTALEQNINYFLANRSAIRSVPAYIKKMFSLAPRTITTKPDNVDLPKRKPKTEVDDTLILGFDRHLVEQKAKLLTLELFTDLKDNLEPTYSKLLGNFRDLSQNAMRTNIATALLMKHNKI